VSIVTSNTISVRLQPAVKERLEALSKSTSRSKSLRAAEAIAAYVEAEEWQISEIEASRRDLDEGRSVGHEKVSEWLTSWSKKGQ
jgi:predicted transcriptional regulator